MNYDDFIESKRIKVQPSGFDSADINPMLFPFQSDITRWALRQGKAALFLDCGMGKTPIQLEWAKQVSQYTDYPVLILAPLAVSEQTAREGEKFGIPVNVAPTQRYLEPGVNVTNYEKLHHFDGCRSLGGIVLDESSILKAQFGKMRRDITNFAESIPYRLCATATPAPNDLVELVNHAEFLGVMSEAEIKALFFTQDGNSSNKFRLKNHAVDEFWKWMAEWSIAMRKPSDLGYEDNGFVLPALNIEQITVDVDNYQAGTLFVMKAQTLTEQRTAAKASLEERVQAAADLVNNSTEPWIVWCNMNYESEALTRTIPDAVEIKGSDSPEHKAESMMGFTDGSIRVLVTKPSIAGFGMNWQHCSNVAFVGLSHSFEQFYQAIRRTWRFGQKNEVNTYVITSVADGAIVENIKRKEKQMEDMFEQIVFQMKGNVKIGGSMQRNEMRYEEKCEQGNDWTLYLGDSVKTTDNVESDSVGLSVFSPPFPGMYVYTNSPHDMGNVKDIDEMIQQFRFLMDKDKLYRIMMPGRNVFIHITQGVAQKLRDGYIGLKDFRGQIISMMQGIGWIYYGEIVIDKDPQLKAMRTKDHGLMFKSLATDAAKMHCAMPDYVLQFKKPGENPAPIRAGISDKYDNPGGWVTSNEWINWARPVWYSADYQPGTWTEDHTGDPCPDGIRETDVLNVRQARETDDERHLCPLQLGVIERVIKVWSNSGEIVYSPFAGIGSEGYQAIKFDRKFIGCELKESYWKQAIRNLSNAEKEKGQNTLFDLMEVA